MRLEELVNTNYDKLNGNDRLICQYIQSHKKQCCDISIEEPAGSNAGDGVAWAIGKCVFGD